MDKLLITRQDLAERLGITYSAVDTLIRNHQIKCVFVGKRRYFTQVDIDEFLEKSHSRKIIKLEE